MKKLLSMIFVAIMVFATFSAAVPVGAKTIYGTCGENLSWAFDDSSGLLTISGTGKMYDYSEGGLWKGYDASIKTVLIADGVTSVGNGAFSECYSLSSVSIPNSVTLIERNAFYYCEALTSVTIPNGTSTIGEDAFAGCSRLTSINIPGSVTSIGDGAFSSCTSLDRITVSGDNTSFVSPGNCLINIKSKKLIAGCKNSKIPADGSVTKIGKSAFCDCSRLSSITIPDSVTSIGDYAFYRCTALKSIKIPEKVTSIGEYAFYGCSLITGLVLPKSVTSIGGGAFCDCTSLKSVTINNGVTKIPELAFGDCTSLKTVTIPGSVTTIKYYAFNGCSALSDVYYICTKESWKKISVGIHNDYLKGAAIHYRPFYKIDYHLGGGKNSSKNPAEYQKPSSDISLHTPTRTGYTFKGWYTDSARTKRIYKIKTGTTGALTLYAKWEKTVYNVKYHGLTGAVNSTKNPKTYTMSSSTDITLHSPSRAGYTFKGWYTDSSYKNRITKIEKGTHKNLELYAKWEKKTYEIDYHLSGGKNSSKNPATYQISSVKEIQLHTPTRTGYTFKGWYTDQARTNRIYKIAPGTHGNLTLYAKWEKKQ